MPSERSGGSDSDVITLTTVRSLKEGQPAGAEVVEQRPERFRPKRHLRVQPPRGVEVERPCCRHGLIHPAHAVDEDLFHQSLFDELFCG